MTFKTRIMKEKLESYFNNKYMFTLCFVISVINLSAQKVTIPIATDSNLILLQTDASNVLKTIYFGKPLENESEYPGVFDAYNLMIPMREFTMERIPQQVHGICQNRQYKSNMLTEILL